MFGINVCEKTNGKQQACKSLVCKGVAYSSTMQMEEADNPKTLVHMPSQHRILQY
jgi:hypothetical protein